MVSTVDDQVVPVKCDSCVIYVPWYIVSGLVIKSDRYVRLLNWDV
jgi:hypothetical protein